MIATRVSEPKCLPVEYPLLQIDHARGLVVLFTSENTGICIIPGLTAQTIGTKRDDWNEAGFNPYHGEITLKNS